MFSRFNELLLFHLWIDHVNSVSRYDIFFNVCRLWANGWRERREKERDTKHERVLSLSARLKYQKGPALIIVLLFHSQSFKHRTQKTLKDLFATDWHSRWVKISSKGPKWRFLRICKRREIQKYSQSRILFKSKQMLSLTLNPHETNVKLQIWREKALFKCED